MKQTPYYLRLLFWPVTALVLFLDSHYMGGHLSYGPWIAAGLAATYLAALLIQASPMRRLAALLFIPFSYVGEIVFSSQLGLYSYADGHIPLYVPLGHSILLLMGLILSDRIEESKDSYSIKAGLVTFYIVLFFTTLLFLNDSFSAFFGTLFLISLPMYRKYASLGLIIGLPVLYIEFIGARLNDWHWIPEPFGIVHTANPPVGAFVFYVLGIVIALEISRGLMSLARYWQKYRVR